MSSFHSGFPRVRPSALRGPGMRPVPPHGAREGGQRPQAPHPAGAEHAPERAQGDVAGIREG